MAESIGAVRVDIIGNAEDLKVEVERAKTLVSSMGPEFEKSYAKMNQSQKTATMAALKFEQQIGKTRDEIKLMSLAARGAAPEALEKVRQKLLQTREAAHGAGAAMAGQTKAFSGSSKTARELQFAMRGLPAQLTDIFTSLASGQRPMMVILQQGGQLKDMFGGIGPAARALGGALRGLINPYTLVAGAVGALGAAYLSAENRAQSFERTVILTGNRLRLTAEDMDDLAGSLDGLAGVTRGEATDALNKIAASGKVTAEQFEEATRAALLWQEATGTAVEDTIAMFDRIRKDPVEAMEQLREKYGFVTEAQVEHVRKLDEQGESQEAATVAFRAWADMIEERAPQIAQHLDPIDRLQKSIGDNAAELWGNVSTGIHDAAREAEEGFGALTRFLGALSFFGAGPAGGMGFLGALQKPVAVSPALPPDPTDQAEADYQTLYDAVYGPAEIEAANRKAEAWIKAGEAAQRALKEQETAAKAAKRALEALNREDERYYEQSVKADRETSQAIESWAELRAELDGPTALALFNHRQRLLDIAEAGKAAGASAGEIKDAQDKATASFEYASQKVAEATDYMTVYADEAARNMQDAFADFLFDPFKDGLDGMLDGLADTLRKMLAQIAASKILQTMGVMGGGTLGGESAGTLFDLFSGSGFGFAKGGVFANSPSLAAYSGGVYDKPHLFKFARGAGIFGEAGPEAIMPLQRGKDGKLGVQANGGGVVVEINNFGGSPVSAREETMAGLDGATLRKIVIDIAAEDVAAGGKLARANKQRFGLREMV